MTGSEGFIGRHLTSALRKSHEVIALDIRGKPDIVHDIRQPLPDIDADLIVHLAAEISVQESLKDPDKFREVNVTGSRNVSELAESYGSRVVFFSSAAVYGNHEKPVKEDDEKNPLSPYGMTKLEAEKFFRKHLIFRPFNVFGHGQNPRYAGVISVFLDRSLSGLPLKVYGGRQTRDFIYIKDVVRAVVKAIERDIRGVFNLGTGKETRIIEIAEWFSRRFGVGIEKLDYLEGEIMRSCADTSKLSKWFAPEYDIWKGLEEMI